MHPIKQLRLNYNLTQKKMSELTGIPMRTMQNWEGGQTKCPEYMIDLVRTKLESILKEGMGK